MIKQVLENANGQFDALGRSVKARKRTLFEGGLKITTTFDPTWQAYAQQAADQPYEVAMATNRKAHPDTSIVTVDAQSGAIRTMLWEELHARRARARYRPTRLALRSSRSCSPPRSSRACRPPRRTRAPRRSAAPSGRTRTTASRTPKEAVTVVDLWTATEDSINVVFAQLILDIGPETVPPVASKMGVTNELPPVAALATGSARSRSTWPWASRRWPTGACTARPDPDHRARREAALRARARLRARRRPDIAHLISAMLQRVPVSGTAQPGLQRRLGPWPVAGKTGTGDLNKAVWFCGYTRQLATAVWGSNGNPYTLGSVFGGTVAAPIWRLHDPRDAGLARARIPEPPPPPTATVPDVTGLDREAAVAQLEAAGFNAAVTEVDSLGPGAPWSRRAPGGSTADLGISVRLEVSNGKPPKTEVPGVIGLGEDEAVVTLEDAGFLVEVVREVVKDRDKVGTVIRQDPPGGTPAPEGATVTVVVGKEG